MAESPLMLKSKTFTLAVHIKSNLIRHMISDIAPHLLIGSFIGNAMIMLDRPLSIFILWIARKRNPLRTLESKGILAVRIVLPIIAVLFIPLIALLATFIERLL